MYSTDLFETVFNGMRREPRILYVNDDDCELTIHESEEDDDAIAARDIAVSDASWADWEQHGPMRREIEREYPEVIENWRRTQERMRASRANQPDPFNRHGGAAFQEQQRILDEIFMGGVERSDPETLEIRIDRV